jgi:hypothetical protein
MFTIMFYWWLKEKLRWIFVCLILYRNLAENIFFKERHRLVNSIRLVIGKCSEEIYF